MDLFATRYNYKLPKFVSLVPDQTAWAVDALSLPWQDLDVYAFPPQPSDLQGSGSGVSQDDSHCSRLAQHGLVLGPSQSVSADSIQPAAAKGSGDSTVQWASSPRSVKSKSAYMAPRTAFIQGNGFSGKVAVRIEAPQNLSLVLHQLTKSPFEPLRKASLKHLTFKTLKSSF